MLSKIGMTLVLILILSQQALAQQSYSLRFAPPGSYVEWKEGREIRRMRCYGFEDFKKIMILDNEHYMLKKDLFGLQEKIGLLDFKLKLRILNSVKLMENLHSCNLERARLTKKWANTDLALLEKDADISFWKATALWGTTGSILIGIVIGGLVL